MVTRSLSWNSVLTVVLVELRSVPSIPNAGWVLTFCLHWHLSFLRPVITTSSDRGNQSIMAMAASPIMNASRFDAEAASWNFIPSVQVISQETGKSIRESVPFFSGSSDGQASPIVLEVGCGTGLLSLQVAPHADYLVPADASDAMVKVLEAKLQKRGAPRNITPVCVLLADPEDMHLPPAEVANPNEPRMMFDLIVSHLVLHHISDLESVLRMMLGCLKSQGMTALTDFKDSGPEARKFHSESKWEIVERHGISVSGWRR
jgi:SAM-dependent methyltransferase